MGDYKYKYKYQREYVFMRGKNEKRNYKKLQVLGKNESNIAKP